MFIRMRKITPGAINGIHIKKFEKDAVYESGVDIPEHLVSAFMSMGVAVEVKGKAGSKAKDEKPIESPKVVTSATDTGKSDGAAEAGKKDEGDDKKPSQDDIIAAIELLDPNNPEHYTQDGFPQVKAIEDILKANISADDRFHAFDAYKKRLEAAEAGKKDEENSMTGPDSDKSVKGAPEDKDAKKKEDKK